MTQNTESPGDSHLEDVFRAEAEGLAGAVRSLLGRRTDVEEALQEAFLRAFKAEARGFRADDRRAWVYVVTMNTAKDLRRRRAMRAVEPLEEVSPVHISTTNDPSAQSMAAERARRARAAIDRLADHEREVFFMRVNAGLPFERIAAALGIPVGTAKSRMRLALARLHTLIGEDDNRSLGSRS